MRAYLRGRECHSSLYVSLATDAFYCLTRQTQRFLSMNHHSNSFSYAREVVVHLRAFRKQAWEI